jgi:hypothetical protein
LVFVVRNNSAPERHVDKSLMLGGREFRPGVKVIIFNFFAELLVKILEFFIQNTDIF